MLSIESLKNEIEGIYLRFKELRDQLTKDSKFTPYLEHQFTYMTKAFSLFVDYYNQYCYSLPRAFDLYKNDFPEDDETTEEKAQN